MPKHPGWMGFEQSEPSDGENTLLVSCGRVPTKSELQGTQHRWVPSCLEFGKAKLSSGRAEPIWIECAFPHTVLRANSLVREGQVCGPLIERT